MGKNKHVLFVCFLASLSVFCAPAPRKSYWNNQGMFSKIYHTAEKGSSTILEGTNINITDESQHVTNIGLKRSEHSDSDESSSIKITRTKHGKHGDSSSSEESRPYWDNTDLFKEIHHKAKKGSTTYLSQRNVSITDKSLTKTSIFSRSTRDCDDPLEDGSC